MEEEEWQGKVAEEEQERKVKKVECRRWKVKEEEVTSRGAAEQWSSHLLWQIH